MNFITARGTKSRRDTDSANHFCSRPSWSNTSRPGGRGVLRALVVLLAFLGPISPTTGQSFWHPQIRPGNALSAAEFARLFRDLSEEGGYFRSDNFTSNETSYLHVVDKLRELGATGGA